MAYLTVTDRYTKMRTIFALVTVLASAMSKELTPEIWNEETAGKTVFLKMYAPWCGHCKKMKPAWDKLMRQYADHQTILVAKVDCTGEGKEICNGADVKGFPSIKYGDPTSLVDYKGARDFGTLFKFTKTLTPKCNVNTNEFCTEEQKKSIAVFTQQSLEELVSDLDKYENSLIEIVNLYDDEVKAMQHRYKELTQAKNFQIVSLDNVTDINILRRVVKKKKDEKKTNTEL